MASALKSKRLRSTQEASAGRDAPDTPTRSPRRSLSLEEQLPAKKSRVRKLCEQLDLRLLRDRRVRRLALAHFTSSAGDGLVLAVLPFAIGAADGSGEAFVAALGVQALALAVFLLPSGVVGDRFNRRRVIVAADFMRFGARGVFAVLLVMGDAALWQLLLAQAVNGAGTALFSATMDGFVPEVFGEHDESRLQKVNALRIFALSLGLTVGPAIGAVVFVYLGASSTFAVDALTFLISAGLLVRLSTPFAEHRSDPATFRGLLQDVRDGWRAFRSIRWFWRVSLAFAVNNAVVFASYFVIGPHVAAESLGGPAAWSAILVGLGIGELIGALILMLWEPKRPLVFATGVVAFWIGPLLLMAVLAPVGFQVGSAVLAGCSFAMFGTIWETVKQTQTPPYLRARLGSFDALASLGPVPLGYVFGGALLGAIGPQASLYALVVVLTLTTSLIATDSSVIELSRRSRKDGPGPENKARPRPQVALAGTGK